MNPLKLLFPARRRRRDDTRSSARKLVLAGGVVLLGTSCAAIGHFVFGLRIEGDAMSSVPERHRSAYMLLLFGGSGLFLLVAGLIIRSWIGPPAQPTDDENETRKPSLLEPVHRAMAWWRTLILILAAIMLVVAIAGALRS